MKKVLSMLLVLALFTGLLTGCGDTGPKESAEAASAVAAPGKTPSEVTEEEAPVEEASVEEVPQEESSFAEDTLVAAEPVVYELPLTYEDASFSIYTTSAPGFMTPFIGTDGSYNTADATRYFNDQTGVTIEFIEIDMFSYTEQFNLMIASGDYPDMLTNMGSYTGGLTKALDDEVIIDLTDYVMDDMPAYAQKLNEIDVWKDVMTDDGQILAVNSINDAAVVDRGPVVRQDWMEAQGLETPVTYEELTEVGKALKSAYDLDYAFYISAVVNPSATLSAGYDLPGFDITASGSHFYQVDGEVRSALVSDNMKEYLRLLGSWYQDGLISGDFFSKSSGDVKEVFANDGCAVCWDNADYITEDNRNVDLMAKGFRCVGLPVALREEGQTLHYALGMNNMIGDSVAITTCCEDPDLLIKTLDWCFTEPGINLSNYGIEGKSYDLDADGNAVWSSNVTEVEGVTFRAALVTYTMNSLPTCWDVKRYWPETYDEDAYAAVELWSTVDNDEAYTMPTSLFFTTDESTIYSTKISDVETYANQFILSAITGEANLDTEWDGYVETVWSLGLQECIDAQQSAVDRYLNRGA